jgi:hypothetical protein
MNRTSTLSPEARPPFLPSPDPALSRSGAHEVQFYLVAVTVLSFCEIRISWPTILLLVVDRPKNNVVERPWELTSSTSGS